MNDIEPPFTQKRSQGILSNPYNGALFGIMLMMPFLLLMVYMFWTNFPKDDEAVLHLSP
jgi:hypothetical protein